MDTQELEAITKKMDKALLAFYQSGAKDDLQVVAAGLDELASRHVYFELLRLDWTERLKAAERVTPKEYLRLLPHKKISHIYSNIDTMQRQIISLIAHALDMDGEKKSVSEKMVAYYNAEGGDTLNTFQFQPQPMSFEVIDCKIFAEVLYPKDIYDLIDFHVRECVNREVRMRVCKNCLRYFAVTGKASTEYCGRICDSKGRTCREMGAINTWTQRKRATRCSRNIAGSTKSVSPASMPAGLPKARSTPGARRPERGKRTATAARSRRRSFPAG